MKHITFIRLNQQSNKKSIFTKPGKYIIFFHNISGDLIFEMKASQIDLDIFGLYTGRGNDSFSVSTTQTHYSPSSRSNLLIKGVFDGNAVFKYKGLIRIEKKAHASHAYQKNQNILLSPNVFVSSQPDLEILAADVFCTHGSTTGKLNEEDTYYLESRGIEKKDAEKILISGFIKEIFDRITVSGFGKEMNVINNNILASYV